jgi:hypothetical protein
VTTLFLLLVAQPATAQLVPPPTATVSLSGPRFGITRLDESVQEHLRQRHIDVQPTITQFGWQFEKQFYAKDTGVAVLHEWVVLVGGLEQGAVLPSVSWMVGVRSKSGSEVGFGPNITPLGVALALAGGTTFTVGPMNVPVNVAVVPSKAGMRVSFITGFSLRR